MSSNATTILFWRNITGSAAMSRWEETRPEASIAPLHAPIRPNSPRCNTSRELPSGRCVTTARSSGAAICSTSRKSWLKSPWASSPSTRGGGNCVTVFIYSVYSMKETKALPQPKAGMVSAQKCKRRSEEHTSELQSHSDLHSFPTRRSSDLWELRYSFHLLGILDERNKSITPAKGWHGKCSKV